jgi:hypothetical protein
METFYSLGHDGVNVAGRCVDEGGVWTAKVDVKAHIALPSFSGFNGAF